MKYFNNEIQNNFKADFGFDAPHRTQTKCSNPVFADPYLHRLAIMKDEHFGHKGDRDENGIPDGLLNLFAPVVAKNTRKIKKDFILINKTKPNQS